eukprot:EG_transcript_29802
MYGSTFGQYSAFPDPQHSLAPDPYPTELGTRIPHSPRPMFTNLEAEDASLMYGAYRRRPRTVPRNVLIGAIASLTVLLVILLTSGADGDSETPTPDFPAGSPGGTHTLMHQESAEEDPEGHPAAAMEEDVGDAHPKAGWSQGYHVPYGSTTTDDDAAEPVPVKPQGPAKADVGEGTMSEGDGRSVPHRSVPTFYGTPPEGVPTLKPADVKPAEWP